MPLDVAFAVAVFSWKNKGLILGQEISEVLFLHIAVKFSILSLYVYK